MTVYRAKRNVALPGGVWKQNTDRELDPSSDLARQLLAAGKIAPVGGALVEEMRPAAPTYEDAVTADLAAEHVDPGDGQEKTGIDHPADGTLSPPLTTDDDRPVDPGPFVTPPTAPRLAGFPAE